MQSAPLMLLCESRRVDTRWCGWSLHETIERLQNFHGHDLTPEVTTTVQAAASA